MIAKVKIGLKKPVSASWFFFVKWSFLAFPPNTQKMRFLSEFFFLNIFTDIPKVPYLLVKGIEQNQLY